MSLGSEEREKIRDRKKATIGHLFIASDILVISEADCWMTKLQGTYFGITWLWYKQDKSLKSFKKQILKAVLLLMTNWTKRGLYHP